MMAYLDKYTDPERQRELARLRQRKHRAKEKGDSCLSRIKRLMRDICAITVG